MPYASAIEIGRIARGLANRTLALAEWTHADHSAAELWSVAQD